MEQWEFDSYGYIEAYIMRAQMALEQAHFAQDDNRRAIGVVAAFPDAFPFFFDGVRPREDGSVPDVDPSAGQVLPDIAEFVEKTANLAVEGENAVIFACFHEHEGVVTRTANMVRDTLAKKGLPEDLVQVVYRTNEGYMRMLKKRADAAVLGDESVSFPETASKTENTIAFFDWDTDLSVALPAIIDARAKNNGTDAASEQTVFVPQEILQQFAGIAGENGGYYVWNVIEASLIRQYLFSDATQILSTRPDGVATEGADPKSVGKFNPDAFARSAQEIAKTLFLKVQDSDKVLLVPENGTGSVDLIFHEKLCPVMAVVPYKNLDEAIEMAKEIIAKAGTIHSVSIWPGDKDAAEKDPASDSAKFVHAVKEGLQASRFAVGDVASSAPAPAAPTYNAMYWTINK